MNIMKCSLHKDNLLQFFCESCEDAVCIECTKQQPHSGCYHKIATIEQIKKKRINHYNNYIAEKVNPQREKVGTRLVELKNFQNTITEIASAIQKDINMQFLNIQSNLKTKESTLILKIQTTIKHQQEYLNNLDDLSYSFQNTVQNPQKFLLLYRKFDQQLKNLQSISVESKIPDQEITLPREIAEAFAKAAIIQQYQERNTFLNFLIQKAIIKTNANSTDKSKELQINGIKILSIYNKVNHDLTSLNQVKACIFCNLPFQISTANEACTANSSYKNKQVIPVSVPDLVRGSKRHYWVDSGCQRYIKPSLNVHSIIRKSQKTMYHNTLKNIKTIKYQLQKYLSQNMLNCQKLFQGDDKNKNGYVSRIAFIFILTKKVQISEMHAIVLANILQNQKGISYRQLMHIVTDPQTIYQAFLKEEQQVDKNRPIAPLTRPKYMY